MQTRTPEPHDHPRCLVCHPENLTEEAVRIRLDYPMAAWLEDLVADERFHLVKEMKDAGGKDGADYHIRLGEVRIAEKVLDYIRGTMAEAGWD